MLIVFIDMGLRLDELISVEIDELDLKRRSLKVHDKKAKDRNIFFDKRTFRTLKHWLRIRERKPEKVCEKIPELFPVDNLEI
ncbi:hypothetical protein KGY79_12360 [Candidatus Bipolaricaulota bacterium]|nr:hypothetical protein [Candidatus Bipolaricaulota bacterium]